MKNPWEAERYAMHSSGKNFLVAGLSPYKIAKIDAFASSFTKSSQNNYHSPIDSANNACYSTDRTKEGERKERFARKCSERIMSV